MANTTKPHDPSSQIPDLLPTILPARGRPSNAAKKLLAQQIAQRQQQQKLDQLEDDEPKPLPKPTKMNTKKRSAAKKATVAPVTQPVPSISRASDSNTNIIQPSVPPMITAPSVNVAVSPLKPVVVKPTIVKPVVSNSEVGSSVKNEVQRSKPFSPVMRRDPSDDPLPSIERDDGLDFIDNGQDGHDQSQTVFSPPKKTDVPSAQNSRMSQPPRHNKELDALANEVKKWEAVTKQVALETREIAKLIKDLSSTQSIQNHVSEAEQAQYRDELLRTAQLSIKADIVQSIKTRDADNREQQVYCVLVLAAALVVAAFLMSPFAEWIVDCLFWVLNLLG